MAPIHIVIIGGGVGGAILAFALNQIPTVTYEIYEASDGRKAQGDAIGLAKNAQRGLELIGMDFEALERECEGIDTLTSSLYMGKGDNCGQIAFNLGSKGDQIIFPRARILEHMLKQVPSERLHMGKKLSSILLSRIEDALSPLIVKFEDGSTTIADAVIGSDGIHSMTRKIMLGSEHPAAEPVYSGMWECNKIVPFDKAQSCIGARYLNPENPQVNGWTGDGGYAMSIPLGDQSVVAIYVLGFCHDQGDARKWTTQVPSAKVKAYLEGVFDCCRGISDCLTEQAELLCSKHWESAQSPTFCAGRICIIGDAAHAPVPWISAGMAMTIEDVMILYKLLGRAQHVEDVSIAFRAYDSTCRPRSQEVVALGRKIGVILMGRDPTIGLDPGKMAAAVPEMFDFVRKVDLESHICKALDAYQELRIGAREQAESG